jgi:hypothetical protein
MSDRRFGLFTTTYKQTYDLLKHITTLDTGAIVILATFFSKSFDNTSKNWLVMLCIGEIMFSLVMCIIGMLGVTKNMVNEGNRTITKKPVFKLDRLTYWLFMLSIIGFVLGIEALAFFVLSNIKA